jgi:hypothetical protein
MLNEDEARRQQIDYPHSQDKWWFAHDLDVFLFYTTRTKLRWNWKRWFVQFFSKKPFSSTPAVKTRADTNQSKKRQFILGLLTRENDTKNGFQWRQAIHQPNPIPYS